MTDSILKLIGQAKEARLNAYSPYGNYLVGALVMTKSGKIFTGCNIENEALGPTICAERVAIFKAYSEGERDIDIVVVTTENSGAPCGVCRQVMVELCPDARVIISDLDDNHSETSVSALMPLAWSRSADKS